jgi:hypothetical protein
LNTLRAHEIEDLITTVSILDRTSLIEKLDQFPATFPIDFTAEFLESQPIERLRHLLVALCLQQRRLPVLLELEPTEQRG